MEYSMDKISPILPFYYYLLFIPFKGNYDIVCSQQFFFRKSRWLQVLPKIIQPTFSKPRIHLVSKEGTLTRHSPQGLLLLGVQVTGSEVPSCITSESHIHKNSSYF
jgi:hypothetical protein